MISAFSLEGKKILVTGASSGIGQQTAIEISRLGATVLITGRNIERLKATYESLAGTGHELFVAELGNANSGSDLVAQLPILNGVVHSAGIGKLNPFRFVTPIDLTTVMQTNFYSPLFLTQEIIKAKKLSKGSSIVFISSVGGTVIGTVGNMMYSASKGALNGILRVLALELAANKIRVNSVSPGMVETPLLDTMFNKVSTEQIEIDKAKYPLGWGKPEDVALPIAFLLSDASKWITGTNIILDGGLTCS
jgi:NAD(P)-dependent dehydrogenase (short-subunit alcohol dehydrogenase family)